MVTEKGRNKLQREFQRLKRIYAVNSLLDDFLAEAHANLTGIATIIRIRFSDLNNDFIPVIFRRPSSRLATKFLNGRVAFAMT